MNNLKGTKTMENLMKSFAGESQARNRYTMYATVADKEGYKQISAIFLETADNERVHGKRFYKLLQEGLKDELPTQVEITAAFPVAFGTTLDYLKAAASGEHEEWSDLYPKFGDIAAEEGFPEIAAAFRAIAKVEQRHEARYIKLANNITDEIVFVRHDTILWKCLNCGYIHEGNKAPEICPSCQHPKGYFEIFVENY